MSTCGPPSAASPPPATLKVARSSMQCGKHPHVCTLFVHVHVDHQVRVYELEGKQLKELIALPFPGTPYAIVLECHRPALVVSDNNTDEVYMSNREGDTWKQFRQLTRSHTDKLDIRSMCMTTPNTLYLYDDKSDSVKQYELE